MLSTICTRSTSASALKTSGSTKRAASAHFMIPKKLRQKKQKKKKRMLKVQLPCRLWASRETSPAPASATSDKHSKRQVRYDRHPPRRGKSTSPSAIKHLRASSSLRSSHHYLELMPNLHPGTENAVSIQGTGNWWPKESQQEPWHTEKTAGGGTLHQNGIYIQVVCRHHQAMISGYSMQNEKTHHSKLHGRPWPSELPYDATVPHRSKPHGRPWPS
jgi:hypothetical protein